MLGRDCEPMYSLKHGTNQLDPLNCRKRENERKTKGEEVALDLLKRHLI